MELCVLKNHATILSQYVAGSKRMDDLRQYNAIIRLKLSFTDMHSLWLFYLGICAIMVRRKCILERGKYYAFFRHRCHTFLRCAIISIKNFRQ